MPRASLSQVVQDSRGGPRGLVADLECLEDEPLGPLSLAVAVEAGYGVAPLDAVAGLCQELDARGRVYLVGLFLRPAPRARAARPTPRAAKPVTWPERGARTSLTVAETGRFSRASGAPPCARTNCSNLS